VELAAAADPVPDPQHDQAAWLAAQRSGGGRPRETPVLAEQWSEYITQQLTLFASAERRNDVYARMRTIAPKLTQTEIRGLAAYYRAGFR
jgi:cytochrome c553